MPGPAAALGAKAAASAAPRAAAAAGSRALASGGGDDGGGAGAKIGGGLLAFVLSLLLLLITPLLLIFSSAAAESCGDGGGEVISTRYNETKPDPPSISALEISVRIYQVGEDLGLGRREILTAYATALVESGGGVTMINHYGGDALSVGVFQQQNFAPWNKRERLNVAAAAHTFYEQLKIYDRGQSIGELAADIQRPREDLRGLYALALDDARRFYERVGAKLGGGGLAGDGALDASACSAGPVGSMDLSGAKTLYQPRSYKTLPANLTSPGRPPQQVDARIYDNVVWALGHYKMRIYAARESGHATHGDGTGLDIVPADGSSIGKWKASTERFAKDLGWSPGCAYSGACPYVPAIQFVGYNGFQDGAHGDPDHTGSAHLHVSWKSSCYGCGGGALVEPREWVKVFPNAPLADGKADKKSKDKRKTGGRR